MANQTRINKFIASCGIASRRGADELIKDGKVSINGKTILEPGILVSPRDKVFVNNKLIQPESKQYVVYNKPGGYITTKTDPQNRKTIYDILPESVHNLQPAGRLDKDSTGLLILTNDGDLIQKLIHPKLKVPKYYNVMADGKVTMEDLYKFQKGIKLEEHQIAYAEAAIIDYSGGITTLEVVLHQGYNRQIRKMFDAVKHPVLSLKRVSHGCISLMGLKKGQFRYMKPKEIEILYNYIKKIKD